MTFHDAPIIQPPLVVKPLKQKGSGARASELIDAILEFKDEKSLMEKVPSKIPWPMYAMARHIFKKIKHTRRKGAALPDTNNFKEKMSAYFAYFAEGTVMFKIPVDTLNGPEHIGIYDAFVGHKIFYLDWQLVSPTIVLCCPNCGLQTLVHDRTLFSKNGSLDTILLADGTWAYGTQMQYDCTDVRV